ncbi:MAG TPA: HAMP domain-containing sensor histidine kinase [Gemmatimonadaceae bacterium]|jgi:signal transduction histidine kinase|nr:HAMP domain-containing sensor histidine kinase [Gemmatimonadaceae bacterium]
MARVYPDAPADARVEALEEQNMHLARVIAELRNQDALKTQFLANISHDLRTPLTAIITHAEIMRDGILGELTDRQAESITGIISGGRQLLDMVGEILTYARGAANQLTLARTEFTVESVVEQVAVMSDSLVGRKEHALSVDVAPELPSVYADREKIAHVLANLLGNAIDFTPPGGRVWIAARLSRDARAPAAVEIEVGDTGIGIAPEHYDLVFREFAQVDASASRQHHGTGLGLAIARKFVELHHGQIWVESKLGEGSRFFFTVPLRAAP